MNEDVGVLSFKEMKNLFPSKERLLKGAVAVVECIESIPCNPCAEVCPVGALTKKSLVDPPMVDHDKCTGCELCVAACPALAIFVLDLSYSDNEALITLPYEFLPVPTVDDIVDVCDKKGQVRGKGRVVRVRKMKDKTVLLTLAINKSLAMDVRSIKVST